MDTLKRIVCLSALLMLLSQWATAQIKIGAAANIITTNWAENYDDLKTRVSVSIGAAGMYAFTERFSGGAELLFAPIGPKLKDPDDDLEGKYILNILQIPLYADFAVIEGLHVHAGLQPGIILSAKTHIKTGPFKGTYDEGDDFRALDMSLILGVSYDITDKITAVFRLNQGLMDLETEDEDQIAKPVGIVLGARYWFWNNQDN